MDFARFSRETTEAAAAELPHLRSRRPSSSPAPHQRVHPNALHAHRSPLPQGSPLERCLQNPDSQSPRPAAPSLQRTPTNADLQSNRDLFRCASPARPLHTHSSDRGLPLTSKSCGQASKCSYMSYQKRDALNKLSANLEQQSAHFNIEQQCAHFNSANLEHSHHIDSFSANLEQRVHSHDFSANLLEQRNHLNNLSANLEQSTHFNSSSSPCCQPLRHSGRHGEPLYRSLLRPHHCSQSPFMDYVEGAHHLHHHQCPFEAETSAVGNYLPHQFADFNPCRFGSPALDENNTSMGSVSKGQNYYSLRAQSNEITLFNWYLIRSSGSHASEIAVGGFLSSRGMDSERIETATIVKRLEECKLLTKDGNVVNLMGPIDDYRTVSNGFSLQTVQLFISGFPHIWNLLVGMGLPGKGIGTSTPSRSCDFNGGEVTSQVSLQKEIQNQGRHLHQSSDPEGKENELASCLEVERNFEFNFVTEECQGVEAVVKAPQNVVPQEQGITLLNGEFQSNEDQSPSSDQVYEKADKCQSPVRTESNKVTEIARDSVEEKSQHEVSHGRMKCNALQLVDAGDPPCEQENMPIEGGEAAVSDIRFEDEEPKFVTKGSIEDSTQEENQHDEDFGEAAADANNPSDLHVGAEADKSFNKKLELTSVQSPEISECCREDGMAKVDKTSLKSLSRKRKVAFSSVDDVEAGRPSCTSLEPISSVEGIDMEKITTDKKAAAKKKEKQEMKVAFSTADDVEGRCPSCTSLEPISSIKSIDMEESMANKKEAAKKKGKRKRKRRFLLPRSKRSSKPMVKLDIDRNAEAVKQESEVCIEEGLGTECKRKKNTSRSRKSSEGQSGTILSVEQHLSTNKTAEGEPSITALVSGTVMDTGVEIREVINEESLVKEAAQKKMFAKKGRGCLAKLRQSIRQTRVYNDSSQVEGDDLVLSTRDSQKGEPKTKESLNVDRRRKSRGADFDLHLDTSNRKKIKPLKEIETCDVKDFTCAKESSERHCNTRAHAEIDSSPSMVASARKRAKMLPPPLPPPLVSISKHLVSKAFGLKTSRSGRLLVPPLAHWRGQSLVRDMDGGIIAIENGSQDTMRADTGCFNFKPPIEAKAKQLQKWLCVTATKCLTKKLKARKKAAHKR